MKKFFTLALLAIAFSSCRQNDGSNRFADNEDFVRIADMQDKRSGDSLRLYLVSEDAAVRKQAALAFASVQDSLFVKYVVALLVDGDPSVRKAAAFAVGQTRCRESETALQNIVSTEKENSVLSTAIEAYGKVTRAWNLNLDTTDHAAAISWSLYRAGLNGAVDSSKNVLAAELLQSGNRLARLGAAHFFSRGAKKTASFYSVLARATQDRDPEVRMAATSALRKIVTDSTFQTLESVFNNDQDYRVRVNAIRSLQAFPFERSKNYLFKALNDKNVNVAIAASEAIIATISPEAWVEVANKAGEQVNWRVQANLYYAVLKVNANASVNDEVKDLYAKSANPYQKASLLSALSNFPGNFLFVDEQLMKADTPVVRSAAADALVSINRHKDFKPEWKKQFSKIYEHAIEGGDPAVIATISQALADSLLGYRAVIKDYTFLVDARKKLSLPKDNEILQSLEAAIAHFERKKNPEPVANAFNHPIDWNFVKQIPADQQVVVHTSKGKITLRMLVDEAPGSVANFIQLAKREYFDKKFFHRVVPNFVIQGGCPRGDGYGGEDYSIRSEFSERTYKTGSVGMASAGKDTEGTQWFITHSPTPHLDGKYTIFAETVAGMDVVNQIEVGDQIVRVEIPGDRK